MKKFKQKLDNFFKVGANGSTIRVEIIAGIVTFLSMSYILTLNPSLITGDWSQSSPLWASVFIATALGAIVGTGFMAFVAKMPLAQAPGLGLNSMVGGLIGAGTLLGIGSLGFKVSFGNAMLLVFVSGILFLLLSVIKIKGVSIREKIFDGMPASIRSAISVGIGLFIAFIGLVNAGIIVPGNGTLVSLVQFNNYDEFPSAAIVLIFGLICIGILEHFKVKGAVIIGIILATLLGIPLGITTYSGMSWKFWEYFGNFFSMDPEKGGSFFALFTEGFKWAPEATIMPCIMTVISFSMIDMFDTMGTVVGCASAAGLMDENGKPQSYEGIMISDSVATCAGAMFGTSTVTTFVESGSGVAAGGKTGLTALSTTVCFFLAIFLMPLIASVPSAAASSALVYVGCLMIKGAKDLKLSTIKEIIPAFLTIALMPLTYSITNGIGFGVLSYVVIEAVLYLVQLILSKVNSKKYEKPKWEVSVVCLIIALLFLVYFFVPTSF